MQKQKLLIIIDNLQRGGAEMLLAGILPELNIKYDVILVTLTPECDFDNEQIVYKEKYILGFDGKISFFSCIWKLKKIIQQTSPALIHAHLYYSSLIARLACPSSIPLIYTIHNELSKNIFNQNKLYKFAEKISIRKNHSIIAVSQVVLDDYIKTIEAPKHCFILRNYIADEYFEETPPVRNFMESKNCRLIAVGNLKASKNYEYLLQSMVELQNVSVTLDIYGNTDYTMYPQFLKMVKEYQLDVHFKGKVDDIKQAFSNYDLYIMSSKYEGFGIAAVEAMSSGLPVILSDIPVLREVTFNNGLFFNLNDSLSLSNLIKEIVAGKHNLQKLSANGLEVAKKYTRQKYLDSLFSIYKTVSEELG